MRSAAGQDVVSIAPMQGVVPAVSVQNVIPVVPINVVRPLTASDGVVVTAAIYPVPSVSPLYEVCPGIAVQRVVARVSENLVVPVFSLNIIISEPAVYRVVSRTATDGVASVRVYLNKVAAVDKIIPAPTENGILPRPPDDRVFIFTSMDLVVPGVPLYMIIS